MNDLTASDLPLVRSAADFRCSFGSTDSQTADLQKFYTVLEEWNQRMNLVGPSALSEFWCRHVLDSAQLFHVEHSALLWADAGAGAGFPGVVLAVLLKDRAGARIHLVESVAKRVAFLRHVIEALALPAEVHHTRVETLTPPAGIQIVTARAFAPLPRLLDYTAHFFKAGAKGLFLKGSGVEAELIAARQSWTFKSDLIESRSDSTGRILRVEELKRRG